MQRIVLCTANPGKRKELRALLPARIQLVTLEELGIRVELPETGETLETNALQKARTAYALCGMPCLADDSGLEVDALAGEPGVHSAHFAGPARDPDANMALLLSRLQGKEDRNARFRTVLALVSGRQELLFDGVVHGTIARERNGTGGFGYDPLFIPEGQTSTFAAMIMQQKNEHSHRQRAVRALLRHLVR
jgi:XTP/dITP diphosphohydrolase